MSNLTPEQIAEALELARESLTWKQELVTGEDQKALARALLAEHERAEARLHHFINPEPLDEHALAGLKTQPVHPDDAELDDCLRRAKIAEQRVAELEAARSGLDLRSRVLPP